MIWWVLYEVCLLIFKLVFSVYFLLFLYVLCSLGVLVRFFRYHVPNGKIVLKDILQLGIVLIVAPLFIFVWIKEFCEWVNVEDKFDKLMNLTLWSSIDYKTREAFQLPPRDENEEDEE